MTKDKKQPGLGRVVYSVDDEPNQDSAQETEIDRIERAEVDEADKESFPASDAPSYAGGRNVECE